MDFSRAHSTRRPGVAQRFASPRAAFTLVEVMAAAAVLILVICSSVLVLLQGLHAIDAARKNALAAQIMQSEIERIRLMSWEDVNNTTILPRPHAVDIATLFQIDASIAKGFKVKRDVVPVTGRTDSMVDIVLEVEWAGTNQVAHKRKFTTRYCKNGLNDFYYTLPRS